MRCFVCRKGIAYMESVVTVLYDGKEEIVHCYHAGVGEVYERSKVYAYRGKFEYVWRSKEKKNLTRKSGSWKTTISLEEGDNGTQGYWVQPKRTEAI